MTPVKWYFFLFLLPLRKLILNITKKKYDFTSIRKHCRLYNVINRIICVLYRCCYLGPYWHQIRLFNLTKKFVYISRFEIIHNPQRRNFLMLLCAGIFLFGSDRKVCEDFRGGLDFWIVTSVKSPRFYNIEFSYKMYWIKKGLDSKLSDECKKY